MTCSGAISAIIILNFFCSFVYLYFCAVAWEYACRGEEDKGLIAKEAARLERSKIAKEQAVKDKQVLAQMEAEKAKTKERTSF